MSKFGRGKWYNENKVGKLSHEGGEVDGFKGAEGRKQSHCVIRGYKFNGTARNDLLNQIAGTSNLNYFDKRPGRTSCGGDRALVLDTARRLTGSPTVARWREYWSRRSRGEAKFIGDSFFFFLGKAKPPSSPPLYVTDISRLASHLHSTIHCKGSPVTSYLPPPPSLLSLSLSDSGLAWKPKKRETGVGRGQVILYHFYVSRQRLHRVMLFGAMWVRSALTANIKHIFFKAAMQKKQYIYKCKWEM